MKIGPLDLSNILSRDDVVDYGPRVTMVDNGRGESVFMVSSGPHLAVEGVSDSSVDEVVDMVSSGCDVVVSLTAPDGKFINMKRLRAEMRKLSSDFVATAFEDSFCPGECDLVKLHLSGVKNVGDVLSQKLMNLLITFESCGGGIEVE